MIHRAHHRDHLRRDKEVSRANLAALEAVEEISGSMYLRHSNSADDPTVALLLNREWTKHGGHEARFLFATVSRPSRTAALVTATR